MKKNILFVEDDPNILELFMTYFSKFSHVTSAAEGNQALELIKSNNFDIVVTDLHMPNGMSGFELIDKINLNKPKNLKLYVVSGCSDLKSNYLLIDGFFDKPFSFKNLKYHLLEKI